MITQPDRRRGRGSGLTPSPVKAAALELGLEVSERVDDAVSSGAELGVVVAFGRIIRPHVLEQLPMVNLHFSLLPRWRGAAPVERAILAGDAETGVCIMEVERGLDTGGVFRRETTPIDPDETAAELTARLGEMGSRLLVDILRGGLGVAEPQQGAPTYAAKITPADLELRWEEPAERNLRVIRVGPAWTTFRGERLLVTKARDATADLAPGQLLGAVVGCGQHTALELVEVKPAGRGAMGATAWVNGAHPTPEDRLRG